MMELFSSLLDFMVELYGKMIFYHHFKHAQICNTFLHLLTHFLWVLKGAFSCDSCRCSSLWIARTESPYVKSLASCIVTRLSFFFPFISLLFFHFIKYISTLFCLWNLKKRKAPSFSSKDCIILWKKIYYTYGIRCACIFYMYNRIMIEGGYTPYRGIKFWTLFFIIFSLYIFSFNHV